MAKKYQPELDVLEEETSSHYNETIRSSFLSAGMKSKSKTFKNNNIPSQNEQSVHSIN
jgi:hypothetical protein